MSGPSPGIWLSSATGAGFRLQISNHLPLNAGGAFATARATRSDADSAPHGLPAGRHDAGTGSHGDGRRVVERVVYGELLSRESFDQAADDALRRREVLARAAPQRQAALGQYLDVRDQNLSTGEPGRAVIDIFV